MRAGFINLGLLWLLATPCFADKIVLNFKTTYDYMISPYYDCAVSDQRILKSTNGSSRACIVNVHCIPNQFKDKLKERSKVLSCEMHNGACGDAFACARNSAKGMPGVKNPWSPMPFASAAKAATNPLKDTCKYEGKLDRERLFQFPGTNEKRCVESYSCNGTPKPKIIACEPIAENKKEVCPQINDCLTNPIPLAVGYTHKQLDTMSADQKAAALNEMDHGPESVDLTAVSIHADPMTAEAEAHP